MSLILTSLSHHKKSFGEIVRLNEKIKRLKRLRTAQWVKDSIVNDSRFLIDYERAIANESITFAQTITKRLGGARQLKLNAITRIGQARNARLNATLSGRSLP